MVTIENLNITRGDKKMYLEDGTPEERDKLAEHVRGLQKSGFTLFLIQGKENWQITGYDKKKHEWKLLVDAEPATKGKRKTAIKKVSAKETTATSVAPQSGG